MESKVCRLYKLIYGLKQSTLKWFRKFDEALLKEGFFPSTADGNVYIKTEGTDILIVALYVDDTLLIGNDLAKLTRLKYNLSTMFKIKDLGEITYFLAIQVYRDRKRRRIYLSQPMYIDLLLNKFGMLECKIIGSPMKAGLQLFNYSIKQVVMLLWRVFCIDNLLGA